MAKAVAGSALPFAYLVGVYMRSFVVVLFLICSLIIQPALAQTPTPRLTAREYTRLYNLNSEQNSLLVEELDELFLDENFSWGYAPWMEAVVDVLNRQIALREQLAALNPPVFERKFHAVVVKMVKACNASDRAFKTAILKSDIEAFDKATGSSWQKCNDAIDALNIALGFPLTPVPTPTLEPNG
jgi:hypothetical protein